MKAVFFPTPRDFRAWLEANHARELELLVGFHKKVTGRPSITWPESVDEALCFGWIDGIRRRIDEASYSIRFTPRKPTSNWSAINIRRVAVLTKEKRMHAAGLAAFDKRQAKRSGIYSYEQRHRAELSPDLARHFRAKKAAWTFFLAQPPGYRQQMIYRVMSAKREETRLKRLEDLIRFSAAGKRML